MTIHDLSSALNALSATPHQHAIKGIKRGIERESLRIKGNGAISTLGHPKGVGSALTNGHITTDFSESLLEFITPVSESATETLAQLKDLQKFTLEHMGDELLWPISMPCFIEDQDDIVLAQFGNSNTARMKTLYREGLKNRYGSMMQAIAGVHFNFSLPDTFWDLWINKTQGSENNKETKSAAYFAMIRNYRRFCWLIPYLYGASPAICSSFVKGKSTTLPFKKIGKGSLYLPYATSLRMSDLGYTNSAQSGLMTCYNQVDTYIESLRKAISTPSDVFEKFAGKKDGQYQQLNSNVLQIENELYSPIRPKQPTKPLEKPTDALQARGVEYIEVRALDVNPFSDIGIERNQFFFLDVFLVYCVVMPSPDMTTDSYRETEMNLRAVVDHGRDPSLTLTKDEETIAMTQWAATVFDGMRQVAKVLDSNLDVPEYSLAVEHEWQKILDPEKTPSAKVLAILLANDKDNGVLGLELASSYKARLHDTDYQFFDAEMLSKHAMSSLEDQRQIEESDTVGFDQFLSDYFTYQFA